MKLLFYIPSQNFKKTYGKVCSLLNNREEIIFNAMAEATADTSFPFTPPPPGSPVNKAQVHQEIEKKLDSFGLRDGPLIAIKLMDEIVRSVKSSGGISGLDERVLRDATSFKTAQNVYIRPNDDFQWFVAWIMKFSHLTIKQKRTITLDLYKKEWGEIVPSYIAEYINSAITLHDRGMVIACSALLSVSVEATLRDVLEHHGYTYMPGSSPVDIFEYCDAEVGVSGNSYQVIFRGSMPKSVTDFHVSTAGASNFPVQIRRVNNRGRMDLNMIVPPGLIDHWSSDRVVQQAHQSVTGLGTAFRIARRNNIILPSELPLDFDEIIAAIRNNVIHLSRSALGRTVPSSSSQLLTLEMFLEDPVKVYDLITTVPEFINGQYNKLRQAGYLHS